MDSTTTPTVARWRGRAAAAALVAAGAVGGGILASSLAASADDSSTATTTTAPSYGYGTAPANGQQPGPGMVHGGPIGGADPVRDDEQALSDANAAKVKAAALEAVPGGTVYRVETDAGDGVYEAHMTKANGTPVTVKLDKDFNVTAVEDGMGTGDPAPAGAPPAAG